MTRQAIADDAADAGAIARLSGIAMVVGLLAGLGASIFVAVLHHLTHLLWHTLPEALGLDSPPWYLVVGLPLAGAALTWAATGLPGHAGHGPLDGFRLDISSAELASVLLGALASLCFGAVLGPEAPLVAIGTAVGAAVVRGPGHPARQVMMVVGAMAAAGAVLGNPLVTSILMLELALAAGAAMARPAVLVPALVGVGSGYLLQVGVGQWTGLGQVQMGIAALPAYDNVRAVDLLAGVPLAVAVALVAVLAQLGGRMVAAAAGRARLAVLLGVGGLTGLSALAAATWTGQPAELVLFAGQTSMTAYVALPSLAVAGVILLAKFVAFVACLGGGFKGGSLFPAIALGAVMAGMGGLVMGAGALPALVATAVAAATAGAMGLPFTGVLLAVLLTIPSGPAVTVPAILGAVVGMLVNLAASRIRVSGQAATDG